MAYDELILHDARGVNGFTISPSEFGGVEWSARTGIGVISGTTKPNTPWEHGVVVIDGRPESACDDAQIVACFIAGVPWKVSDPKLWDRGNSDFYPEVDWEKFQKHDVPVLTRKASFDLLMAFSIYHPGTPI